jgi:hypothetical protein
MKAGRYHSEARYQISGTPTFARIKRHSVVGIATGYGLDDQEVGVRVPVGSRILSSLYRSDGL